MKLFLKQLAEASIILQLVMPAALAADTTANTIGIGVVGPVPASPVRPGIPAAKKKKPAKAVPAPRVRGNNKKADKKKPDTRQPKAAAKPPAAVRPAQQEVNNVSKLTLAPGVVLKRHRGALNINILDVDLKSSALDVKPVLASESFNRLDEVRDQAAKVKAIAAVNANYFKKDGTPLGTLIVDGEWMAGPLFDRISMGFTARGDVFIDNPRLHGILETSNPSVPNIWINNINQPRRHGAHVILYTRRWGGSVRLPYMGTLVAVDAGGKVIDKSLQFMTVPYNGYVLSDSRKSEIAKLQVGDVVNLSWHPKPDRWNNVVHAISGGPCLIRHGNLFVNLQGEHFRKNWTSSTIHARTAAGITKDKRLIMVTVEGKHTLWEVAKLLKELGCVDAMNLDGGGSTTMVVNGDILTRNRNSTQRRVAATLAVLPRTKTTNRRLSPLGPDTNLTDLTSSPQVIQDTSLADPMTNVLSNQQIEQSTTSPLVVRPGLEPDVIQTTAAAPAETYDYTRTRAKKKKKRGFLFLRKPEKQHDEKIEPPDLAVPVVAPTVTPVSQTEKTEAKPPKSKPEKKKSWWSFGR